MTLNDPCLLVIMPLQKPLPLKVGYTRSCTSNEENRANMMLLSRLSGKDSFCLEYSLIFLLRRKLTATLWATLKKGPWKKSESLVAQLCPSLCDPMDCRLPGSSVHGIFQARVLEWVAISFSRRSSRPSNRTRASHIVGRHYHLSHQGSPMGKERPMGKGIEGGF